MLERIVEYYRRINRPRQSEDSRGFRAAVLVTVLISVIAAVQYARMSTVSAVLIVLGITAGSVLSYYRRDKSNLLLKFMLTLALIGVFAYFLSEIPGSLHDLRYPLIGVFLWVQVLHSFDLPARRDLYFSLASATILIAFGGSLSFSMDFLAYLITFFFAATLSLYLGHLSSLRDRADAVVEGPRWGPRRMWIASTLLVLPLSLGVFMLLPRFAGIQVYSPFSAVREFFTSFSGEVVNPAYPVSFTQPGELPEEPPTFADGVYFNNSLDLRVRGVPGDETVMKVRSTEPAYWRSLSFDEFEGYGWTMSDERTELMMVSELPFFMPEGAPYYDYHRLTQTFILEKEQPNTIFCSYRPDEIYYDGGALRIDSYLGVRAPGPLREGLIYTVVSNVSDATPGQLRTASSSLPEDLKEQYLQLPEDMPERVGRLAERICEGKTGFYDKALAIQEHLRRNYEYHIMPRPQENDQNSVDFFLFEERRGNCEHFASAMAVMCREVGVPARIAVGYDTGDYNPFTGYYEVSQRDAHAWTEVFFPYHGWIPFEPTAGFSGRDSMASDSQLWSGFRLISYLGEQLGKLVPVGALKAVGRGCAWFGREFVHAFRVLGSTIADSWRGICLAAAALLGLLMVLGFYLGMNRGKREAEHTYAGGIGGAVQLFDRMSVALSRAGYSRAAYMTPLEYARYAGGATGIDAIERFVGWFNRVRYGGKETAREELREMEAVVSSVESQVSGRVGRRRR